MYYFLKKKTMFGFTENHMAYFAVAVFVVLLFLAIFLIRVMYICDHQGCQAFLRSDKKFEKGTKDYTISLLQEVGNDGIWPFALIGAAISTAFAVWFTEVNFSVRLFTMCFVPCFICIYALISYYQHHYLKPINKQAIENIRAFEDRKENKLGENELGENELGEKEPGELKEVNELHGFS